MLIKILLTIQTIKKFYLWSCFISAGFFILMFISKNIFNFAEIIYYLTLLLGIVNVVIVLIYIVKDYKLKETTFFKVLAYYICAIIFNGGGILYYLTIKDDDAVMILTLTLVWIFKEAIQSIKVKN